MVSAEKRQKSVQMQQAGRRGEEKKRGKGEKKRGGGGKGKGGREGIEERPGRHKKVEADERIWTTIETTDERRGATAMLSS